MQAQPVLQSLLDLAVHACGRPNFFTIFWHETFVQKWEALAAAQIWTSFLNNRSMMTSRVVCKLSSWSWLPIQCLTRSYSQAMPVQLARQYCLDLEGLHESMGHQFACKQLNLTCDVHRLALLNVQTHMHLQYISWTSRTTNCTDDCTALLALVFICVTCPFSRSQSRAGPIGSACTAPPVNDYFILIA